jgi:predicted nucleic acid-binding protein
MSAIVNATPLIALALVDRLDLLQKLFGEVIVPKRVYAEVTSRGRDRPGAQVIAQLKWLQVVSVETMPTIEPLLLGLDPGEVDVLLLAREYRPDWVVIDERQARRVARAMGIPVKGTLGILLAGVLAGLLSKEAALGDLQALIKGGIRISPHLQNWLRDELSKETE